MQRIPKWLYTPTRVKNSRKARTMRQAHKHKRGGAIIMVMLLTMILGAMAADLHNNTQVNLKLATNARDRLQAHFHARSAVQLELFFLRYTAMLDKTIGKFIPIPLADMSSFFVSSDTMKGLLKRDSLPDDDYLSDGEEEKEFGDFQGSFWIDEVVDENRKINIGGRNRVTMAIKKSCLNPIHLMLFSLIRDERYDILFENMGETRDPDRNRIEMIGNITDFTDTDDVNNEVCTLTGIQSTPGSGPSEENRYRNLPYNAEYKSKNGPMLSVEELRLVPGVNDAFMRLFANNFTVWTDNLKIDLRHVNDQLLIGAIYAIMNRGPLPGDEERFTKFFEERNKTRILPPPLNNLSKDSLLLMMRTAELIPDLSNGREQLFFDATNGMFQFTDATKVYKISAVGRVGDTVSRMTVVWRDPSNGKQAGDVYYWRED
ncbi:MAG: hypothetical protein VYC39_10865 [Myxococcota bacterium]|nr:hypothetical protein [Myxococcota bacterium]